MARGGVPVTYDPTRVAAFLGLAAGLEVNLFADSSIRILDSQAAIAAIRAFEALTLWERVNALYAMRDRAVAAINARIALALKAARDDDDRRERQP